MGLHQELLNYDEIFLSQTGSLPEVIDYDELSTLARTKNMRGDSRLIINNASDVSEDDREYIKRNVYTHYTDDSSIENLPTCDCPMVTSRFNIGVTCDHCGGEFKDRYDSEIHAKVWIKAPRGIPAMINTMAFRMLSERFNGLSKFDVIRWLTDTSYVGPNGKPPIIMQLEREKIPRGLSNFYKHFDSIMDRLFSINALRRGPAGEKDEVREFVKRNRQSIFCQYIPIPNKILFVIENTNFGAYMDLGIAEALNALWLMRGIDSDLCSLKQWQKENRTAKANAMLADYNVNIFSSTHTQKEGLLRGLMFANRAIFASRTVISSITDNATYQEIHIPWGVATTIFRPHIVNILTKEGWMPRDIRNFIADHAVRYHPRLAAIFKQLIDSAKQRNGMGIPFLAARYPTLQRGSVPFFFCTKVFDDPMNITSAINILTTRQLNADYTVPLRGNVEMITSLIAGTPLELLVPLRAVRQSEGLIN